MNSFDSATTHTHPHTHTPSLALSLSLSLPSSVPNLSENEHEQDQCTPSQLIALANTACEQQDFQRALDLCTSAIQLCKYDSSSNSSSELQDTTVTAENHSCLATLYANRSAVYYTLQDYVSALADANSCIQVAPEWFKGYLRKGLAEEAHLRYEEACRSYEMGSKLDPDNATLSDHLQELTIVLEKIKSVGESSPEAHPDVDRFTGMINWLKNGKASFPKLLLQYYSEDYRGVHATADIKANELILYIPESHIMTSQKAMQSNLGQKLLQSKVELRAKHTFLAVYLLSEKSKGLDSFWFPYINILPKYFATIPIFFSEELLSLLRGSFTLQRIRDRIESLSREYLNICAAVPEINQWTKDEFIWARLAIITRIFGIVIRGTKTDGLVPFADMLNHKQLTNSFESDTKWKYDDRLEGFTIWSLRDIPRNEQVYDSYGRKCNSRFFVNYGFALKDNDYDNEALIRVPLVPSDRLFAIKIKLLRVAHVLADARVTFKSDTNHGMSREFLVPANYDAGSEAERKPQCLFGFVRFICADAKELGLLLGDYQQLLHIDLEDVRNKRLQITPTISAIGQRLMHPETIPPLTLQNEYEVCEKIRRIASEALSEFDSTIDEDQDLLQEIESVESNDENDQSLDAPNSIEEAAAAALNTNMKHCIIMRLGEKMVLQFFIDLTTIAKSLLEPFMKNNGASLASFENPFSKNIPPRIEKYTSNIVIPLIKACCLNASR